MMNDKLTSVDSLSPEKKRELLEKLLKEQIESANSYFPLSYGQQALWLHYNISPESTVYNLATAIRIYGSLDHDAFEQAVCSLLDRHPALRMTFSTRSGEPMQQVQEQPKPNFEIANADGWTAEQIDTYILQQLHIPFSLEDGPIYRMKLLQCSENEHVLYIVVHHIVYDGRSTEIVLHDLFMLYAAASTGDCVPGRTSKIGYQDFVKWQNNMVSSSAGESQLNYWKQQLAGELEELDLPYDHTQGDAAKGNGCSVAFVIGIDQVSSLHAIAKKSGTTLYTVVLAALQVLLSRYSGQDEVRVGSPAIGRAKAEFESVVGHFINTIVFKGDLSGNPTFRRYLDQTHKVVTTGLANQDYPFTLLVEQLHTKHHSPFSQIFQVMMDWQVIQNTSKDSGLLLGGPGQDSSMLQAEPLFVPQQEGLFDLYLDIKNKGGELIGLLKFDSSRFNKSTVERMVHHFQVIISEIIASPDRPIGELSLFSEEDYQQILIEWNNTAREFPDVSIQALVETQVKSQPDAVAVRCDGVELSYAELNAQANQLAHHLRMNGVLPGTPVGICMDRSVGLIAGMLGILKAGGAYLPLDITYPGSRISYILDDSQTRIIVTEPHLVERLPSHEITIYFDDVKSFSNEQLDILPGFTPESLAYIIYTSGSTGKPKGVKVPHRAVVNFLNSMAKKPGISKEDVLLAVTTISFDIHVLELFLPLISGARIELAVREVVSDARRLLSLLLESGISILQATPTTWRMLIESGWNDRIALKALCGGEALPPDLARQLTERCTEVWNMYGPTETTVWSSVFQVPQKYPVVLVGQPIDNTRFYILDKYHQPVPIGVTGELFIGGDGVTCGYINRPDLEKERFVANLFGSKERRLYRTGDLARFMPDGNVDVLGRTDYQVKIRGFRIELGEIESVILEYPGINESVVTVREDADGDQRLAAYITSVNKEPVDELKLRELLRQRLPDYMVPANIVTLDAIPLTPNGKIDRKVLPAPSRVLNRKPDIALELDGEVEVLLARIWEELLDIEGVGPYDTFFDLGGHSLLTLKIVDRFERESGIRLNPGNLMTQTLRQLVSGLKISESSKKKHSLIDSIKKSLRNKK